MCSSAFLYANSIEVGLFENFDDYLLCLLNWLWRVSHVEKKNETARTIKKWAEEKERGNKRDREEQQEEKRMESGEEEGLSVTISVIE